MTPAECGSCLGPVDEDGNTTGECPVSRPDDAECPDCGACYCDGSC